MASLVLACEIYLKAQRNYRVRDPSACRFLAGVAKRLNMSLPMFRADDLPEHFELSLRKPAASFVLPGGLPVLDEFQIGDAPISRYLGSALEMSNMPDSPSKSVRAERAAAATTDFLAWTVHVTEHIEDTLAMIAEELSHDDVKVRRADVDFPQQANSLRLTEFPLDEFDWGHLNLLAIPEVEPGSNAIDGAPIQDVTSIKDSIR